MFTIADIRNIAIQIERNGEETYRKAAQVATDPDLARLLERMADDERAHAEWFESIKEDRELSEEQRELEAVGKSILQEMVRDKTFSLESSDLKKVDSVDELLAQSQGFEQDTIMFYEMLSGFIENKETMAHLKSIIAEEQNHYDELEKIFGASTTEA